MLSGCAGVVLVGAGAGAFSYVAGSLARVYEADYQASVKASTKVMQQLNFKQKEESAEGLKTTIEGSFNPDTPMTIEVVYVDPGWTQIGVRTGYIGSNNLEISKQVHTDIAEELKRLKTRTMPATSQMENETPRTLRATSQKKVILAEDKPRALKEPDAPSPAPQKTNPTSAAGINETPQSSVDRQEQQALSQPEKRQDETEQHTAAAQVNEPDVLNSLPETVSTPLESDTDNTQELKEQTDKLALANADKQQGKKEELTSAAQVNEPDVLNPLPETVSTPLESDSDDTQGLKQQSEKRAVAKTESKNKTFVYDPESELTIHSGSYGELDEVISYLAQNPSARVDICAYTKAAGDVSRNLSLSQKRVFEIRNYLILNGISEERITAEELGENNFLENNHAEKLGSLNYPVVMTIK